MVIYYCKKELTYPVIPEVSFNPGIAVMIADPSCTLFSFGG
jgi:hypothetical protein